MMKPTQFWRTFGMVLCVLIFIPGVLVIPAVWLIPMGAEMAPVIVKISTSLAGVILCGIDYYVFRKVRAIDDDSTDYRYTICCNLLFLYNSAIVLGVLILVLKRFYK